MILDLHTSETLPESGGHSSSKSVTWAQTQAEAGLTSKALGPDFPKDFSVQMWTPSGRNTRVCLSAVRRTRVGDSCPLSKWEMMISVSQQCLKCEWWQCVEISYTCHAFRYITIL